jgi:hypothetical protein
MSETYIKPEVGQRVRHIERPADRVGEISHVFPDELEEGPGHRMVKVKWPGPIWTYEASFMLRAAEAAK